MALLTADDVLNKKFQYVKFREGYDQIEVDEFLDEVVATIYSLSVENAELKEKLEAANRRIAELSSEDADRPAAPAPEVVEVEPVVEEEVAVEEVAPPAPVAEAPADPNSAEAAASMLALAQRLHDEYVDEGREEGEKIVSDARSQGELIVAEAENKRSEILDRLASEQQELEQTINNLREFETDYRSAISTHLQTLLKQVDQAPGKEDDN